MPAERTARLAQHAQARHEQTVQRAQAALSAMARDGDPVTVANLAAKAAVSRAWIYTQPGLRDQIEQIRQDTTRCGSPCRQPGSRASEDSLRRRLELAHQRISQLRAENQQLRRDLAIAHGHLRTAASGGTRP
ncbi:MAG: hypothetical protein JO287_09220 [Pseudonocardiales bacterium]|nr:hypothetical protein [Pseudonocardiales bacterium]